MQSVRNVLCVCEGGSQFFLALHKVCVHAYICIYMYAHPNCYKRLSSFLTRLTHCGDVADRAAPGQQRHAHVVRLVLVPHEPGRALPAQESLWHGTILPVFMLGEQCVRAARVVDAPGSSACARSTQACL
jgi:hypothetical protein